MPSGYERSPDYGGPPPTWWGIAAIVLGDRGAGRAIGVCVRLVRNEVADQ
jgi:hypothetical protein